MKKVKIRSYSFNNFIFLLNLFSVVPSSEIINSLLGYQYPPEPEKLAKYTYIAFLSILNTTLSGKNLINFAEFLEITFIPPHIITTYIIFYILKLNNSLLI